MPKPDADGSVHKQQRSVGWGATFVNRVKHGRDLVVEYCVFNPNDASAEHSSKPNHEPEISAVIGRHKAVDRVKLKDNIPSTMHNQARRKAASETTRKRKLPPLPALPDGLRWPVDDFDKSPHFGACGGIARHLEEVWKPLIAANVADMVTLRGHYPTTAKAIDNHRPKLPPDLCPPVRKELTDRKAAEYPNEDERPWRVERALQMRAFRARKKAQTAKSDI